MPRLGPIKRRDLIRYLRQLGFEGPFSGGRHEFMAPGQIRLALPNPHSGREISTALLVEVLRQPGISRAEWEALD
jgi:predicted RNA binding protein YcfA (HicA-like mRNA interferase family)